MKDKPIVKIEFDARAVLAVYTGTIELGTSKANVDLDMALRQAFWGRTVEKPEATARSGHIAYVIILKNPEEIR